jgi:hypothetical protein
MKNLAHILPVFECNSVEEWDLKPKHRRTDKKVNVITSNETASGPFSTSAFFIAVSEQPP